MVPAGKHIIEVAKYTDRFTLYCLGDTHIGNKGCWLSGLRQDVALIAADPHAVVIGMGDFGDYISPADKRWDPATITPDAKVAALSDWGGYIARMVVAELKPLKGKFMGMLYGNHENKYQLQHAQQLHGWVCTELETKNLGYSCFIDLSFRKKTPSSRRSNSTYRSYRIFAHHGAGAAQTSGGKINRLVRFMNANEADVYLIGHLHEKDPKRVDYLAADAKCETLIERRKLGVFTGSYLRTYDESEHAGYGEIAGYSPVPLGCSQIEFTPFDRAWCHRRDSMVARVVV